MAAPAANPNNNCNTDAVDKLTTMFPTIERATIQNIVVNECGGDTTKSIVILTKIQQFNNSNANANKDTVNAGEAVQTTATVSQQIPLQVHAVAYPSAGADSADCCGSNSCACCLMKPASYKNGLYPIDYRMYNISFFLFAALTVYPDGSLDLAYHDSSNHGFYLPVSGLALIIVATVMEFAPNTLGNIRGGLYIFGGLLYALGYIIQAAAVPDYDYDHYWHRYYYYDMPPTAEYLVGRGLFIGIHAMFIGYLYVTNNKLPDVMRSASRVSLIRFWTLLFLVYHLLVMCDDIYSNWSLLAVMALSPLIVAVSLLLNFCLLNQSNESGGCNCGVTLGLLIVISYYFILGWLLVYGVLRIFIYSDYSYHEPSGWLGIWKAAVWVFGSMQLWILSRAMHPANANCGCEHDGSGDGDINVSSAPNPSGLTQTVVVVPNAASSEIQPIAPSAVNQVTNM
eukprot:475429_1